MASPFAHLAGSLGAYLVSTAPAGAAPLRSTGFALGVMAMGLVPDLFAILSASGQGQIAGGADRWDVVAVMHGVTFGVILAAAISGALPGLRTSFWGATLGLSAGHGSAAVLDALSRRGVAVLAPFDWKQYGLGLAILPDADARILWRPFVETVRTVGIELAILLPLVWTAWILGREGGESRSRGRIALFAASWLGAAVAVWWSLSHGGKV